MKSLLLSLSIIVVLCAQDSLYMLLGAEWFPYNYHNENNLVGMDISIARYIADKTDRVLSIDELPFSRGLLYLEEGRADLMVGASKTEERMKYAHFSVPYREEVISILFRKGEAQNYHLDSLADLKKHKLIAGIEPQGWYGEELDRLKQDPDMKHTLQVHTMLTKRLQLLMLNRFDCVIDDKYALLATAKLMGIADSVELHTYNLVEDSVCFMFSKKRVDSSYVESVSDAIREAQGDSSLENIINAFPQWH